MIVLGVDPGSVRCGYGLIRSDRGRLSYLAAGVIQAPARRSLDERLLEIGDELSEVCDEALAKLAPDEELAAGIEAGFADGHAATALVLGAARGVALYVVRSAFRREVRQYAASTVKKAATGSGNADKALVARIVARRLGMQREPAPDAADALAIAIARATDSYCIRPTHTPQ